MVVCGAGAVCVRRLEPNVGPNRPSKSPLTSLPAATAPATFNGPAPWSDLLYPFKGWAVYIKIILMTFGVRLEFASSSRAAVPATTGVDIEVPLRYISFILVAEYLEVSKVGYSLIRLLLAASAEMILLPGASRSGLIRLSKCRKP